MKLDVDYVNKIEFLIELRGTVEDSKYSGPIKDRVSRLYPKNIVEVWRCLIEQVFEWANSADTSKSELEGFVRLLSPGYIRMECRAIWKGKPDDEDNESRKRYIYIV